MHKSRDEFEFWSDLIADYGVICSQHVKTIVSPGFLRSFIQIFLILADNQKLHNILSV